MLTGITPNIFCPGLHETAELTGGNRLRTFTGSPREQITARFLAGSVDPLLQNAHRRLRQRASDAPPTARCRQVKGIAHHPIALSHVPDRQAKKIRRAEHRVDRRREQCKVPETGIAAFREPLPDPIHL